MGRGAGAGVGGMGWLCDVVWGWMVNKNCGGGGGFLRSSRGSFSIVKLLMARLLFSLCALIRTERERDVGAVVGGADGVWDGATRGTKKMGEGEGNGEGVRWGFFSGRCFFFIILVLFSIGKIDGEDFNCYCQSRG